MRRPRRATLAAIVASLLPALLPAAATGGAAPVTIAIVDTGVAPVGGLAARLVPGVDLVDGGSAAGDSTGHGTAMAFIAARICASCRLMPVVAVGGAGFGTTALAAAGVTWAAAHGARVIELSLTSRGDDPALDAAIAAATAGGAVVVVAAGNGGTSDPAAGGYPAAANPEAISVGGLAGGALAPWSNHGPWVDVAAPGVQSAVDGRGAAFTAVGTSAAAAYVSGAVGVLLRREPALAPAAVETLLVAAGQPVPGLDVRSGRAFSAATL